MSKSSAFKIPKRVQSYHPLISEYRELKDSKNLDMYGRLIFRNPSIGLAIKVTPGTFNRACLFLHGIIKMFASYGWELQKDAGHWGDSNKATFVFEGEKEYAPDSGHSKPG
ncbi:MAG: hypothetical protein A6F72_06685 [Cycloclasticus sp. symbiont of Poecilosclerida sp. N]|nr:MAG: hypothetical protein A6F72_06685 [Cycloclasticus sp. symbiont of Poecilosclerida sp. N]